MNWLKELFIYDPLTGEVKTKTGNTGFVDDLGYRRFEISGKRYRAHQIAWFITHDKWCMVDHRNGKGVSFCSATAKWRADIQVHQKRINLGRFNSKEEAKTKYNEAATHYFGEFANHG